MLEQIEQILNKEIRPLLAAHGGEMETLSFVDGVYRFRLRGQCADCPSASLTSETLIAQTLMNAVPQVK
ncbi:MAG: NifU family protein, partial [Pygmaiobacter sp.]